MKLIIQIPCYNEEKTLGLVLSEIPKEIEGITEIKTLIIDDGITDKTLDVANQYNVDYIVKHKQNKGLGNAFKSGIEKALIEGADIVVNTDADNQYPSHYIPEIVKPLIDGKADIVIGDRQTKKINHFSPLKKFFQWLGSLLVRYFSGTNVPDSVSGFRAYSRESLLKLNITSDFSYAVDTLIQAGSKKIKIECIKIQTNLPTRPSRLFKHIFEHMYKTFSILFRVYAMYNPLRLFLSLGTPLFLLGIIGISRFLYYYSLNSGNTGKIQSLVLSGVCIIIAIQFFALGIIGDLIGKNRKLIEDNLYICKKLYYNKD